MLTVDLLMCEKIVILAKINYVGVIFMTIYRA